MFGGLKCITRMCLVSGRFSVTAAKEEIVCMLRAHGYSPDKDGIHCIWLWTLSVEQAVNLTKYNLIFGEGQKGPQASRDYTNEMSKSYTTHAHFFFAVLRALAGTVLG